MKPFLLLTFFISSLIIQANAQDFVPPRVLSGTEVGAAFRKNYTAPSLTYYQLVNPKRQQIFWIGWTARLGTFYANDIRYTTAPARLIEGTTDLGRYVDAIDFERVSGTMLNFGVRAQVKLGRVEVGGSADLLGVGFGRGRIGTYRSAQGRYLTGKSGADSLATFEANPQQRAAPSRWNLRLPGNNEYGALTNEVYVRVLVTERIGVKFAYQWLTTEMRAQNRDVVSDNDRFRDRAWALPYVAVVFPMFN